MDLCMTLQNHLLFHRHHAFTRPDNVVDTPGFDLKGGRHRQNYSPDREKGREPALMNLYKFRGRAVEFRLLVVASFDSF
jgi:hypothetical protein